MPIYPVFSGEVVGLRVISKKAGFMRDSKMNRAAPVIGIGDCSDCGTCVEVCPAVFRINRNTGVVEAVELSEYPEEEIREAIIYCPRDCIAWEEGA